MPSFITFYLIVCCDFYPFSGSCLFQTDTPNKTCCNFPFVYKNIEHYSCIKLGEKSGTYCGTQRHAKKLEKCIIPSTTASPLCSTGCKAVAPPPDETFAFVYIVFGIKRIDKSSIDRRHVLENNEVIITFFIVLCHSLKYLFYF